MSSTPPALSLMLERVRSMAIRLGLVRVEMGWEVVVHRAGGPAPTGRTCAVCGDAARYTRAPAAALALWGRPKPEVRVPLCGRCNQGVWRRLLGLAATAVSAVVATVVVGRLVFLAWPWVPWAVFVMGSACGGLTGWGVTGWALRRWRRDIRGAGWEGVPVRVVAADREGWVVHVASRPMVGALDQVAACPPVGREVVENDTLGPGLAWLFAVGACAWVLWMAWHPEVRLVNVTSRALQVSIDGRRVTLMGAVHGESPNAGMAVRVPEGKRTFRAHALDGELVDETMGRVARGATHLYAPGSEGRCFRLEQRAYGRARQPLPAVVILAGDRSFHALPVGVDAWFQPNPPTAGDLWFSGGVRRAVRLGSCAHEGRSVPPEHR